MDNTYTFMVIEEALDETKPHGRKEFRAPPRVGEYVTVQDEDGVGQAYEVVAVIHPLELADTCGDLILRHRKTDADVRKKFKRRRPQVFVS